MILQKPKPKILVTESAESFSKVSVSDKTDNQSVDRTKNGAQSVTSKLSEEIQKTKIDTPQISQKDSVDSKNAISKTPGLDTSESVQKDNTTPVPVIAATGVSNGSEKETTTTPKKERFIPPLPRSASK